MADEIGLRGDELLERRFDRIEVDVSDKAIDTGVDTASASARAGISYRKKFTNTRKSARPRIDVSRSETADALIIVALAIVLLCFAQALLGQGRMLPDAAPRERPASTARPSSVSKT